MDFRALFYPLGFIASFFFFFRFMVQWIQSEQKKESHVTPIFWYCSLLANSLMALHGLLQMQYPVCLLQTINGVISWRNLNLMRSQPVSRRFTILLGLSAILVTSAIFTLQGALLHELEWMRSPTWSKMRAIPLSLSWHVMGFLGMVAFACRFWLQWWNAEKKQHSSLDASFWILSITGGFLCIFYFVRLHDLVNLLSYGTGLIPYIRNLVLLRKKARFHSSPPSQSLFLFAGEHSGDRLGEKLLEALKKTHPSYEFYGVGGPLMRQAGLKCILPMESFQVMGITAVVKALPRLIKNYRFLKKALLKDPPTAVIFIDYPEFSMLLAKALRKLKYKGKLIHYVSPSVWAWRKNRVYTLAATLDHLLSILPFERECYAKTSLPVTYVGHPLALAIQEHRFDLDWRDSCSLPKDQPICSIFPGSRLHVIKDNLPLQLEAIKPFLQDHSLTISLARPELEKDIKAILEKLNVQATLIPEQYRYEQMQESTFAVATSGTITLELALLSVPTVVTYRLNLLNYLLGRYIFRIRLPFYCLANITHQDQIFPEFIHRRIDAHELSQSLQTLIEKSQECQMKCESLKTQMATFDPSEEAAKTIYQITYSQ